MVCWNTFNIKLKSLGESGGTGGYREAMCYWGVLGGIREGSGLVLGGFFIKKMLLGINFIKYYKDHMNKNHAISITSVKSGALRARKKCTSSKPIGKPRLPVVLQVGSWRVSGGGFEGVPGGSEVFGFGWVLAQNKEQPEILASRTSNVIIILVSSTGSFDFLSSQSSSVCHRHSPSCTIQDKVSSTSRFDR